ERITEKRFLKLATLLDISAKERKTENRRAQLKADWRLALARRGEGSKYYAVIDQLLDHRPHRLSSNFELCAIVLLFRVVVISRPQQRIRRELGTYRPRVDDFTPKQCSNNSASTRQTSPRWSRCWGSRTG
ncbi:unnamed protein product, partial [Discosporangium mesarthrocarpum]